MWSLSFKEALEEAIRLYQAGQIQQAFEITTLVVDQSPTYAEARNFLGVLQHERGDVEGAIVSYDQAIRLNPGDAETLNNKGFALKALGRWPEAKAAFEKVLTQNPNHAFAWNGLGLAYHYTGFEQDSIAAYEKATNIYPNYAEAFYNKGVSYIALGLIKEAVEAYFRAITLDSTLYSAMMNLASVHQQHGKPSTALYYYELVANNTDAGRDLKTMAHTNMGTLHYVDYAGKEAAYHYGKAKELILQEIEEIVLNKGETRRAMDMPADRKGRLAELQRELVDLKAHMSRLDVAICNWENADEKVAELVRETRSIYKIAEGVAATPCCIGLMVFDTLLLPVENSFRKDVGLIVSKRWSHDKIRFPFLTYPLYPTSPTQVGNKLRLGYLSYDFNDHPTAHMVEGLFKHHNRARVEGIAYSYGRHDRSVFRYRIEQEMDNFINMVEWSHLESSQRIRRDQVHILFDLQCHTRGSRPAIAAVRPAPIAVNMLIFPGTNGAPWLDYLICDSHVAQPEQSRHFVEKLVYLPDTYQVNYYPIADFERGLEVPDRDPGQLSKDYIPQTPSPAPPTWARFVFANFNKIDKLEHVSWNTWMRILQRVPGSILWLLEPSEVTKKLGIKKTLNAEAMAAGVHPRRIIFAPRRSKRFHLGRFKHAHLFIDTFVYGAHSTATDALRGGLPVLTFERQNFASRVASSLLRNVDHPEMSTLSIKTFEDVAVRLATGGGHILNELKLKLTTEGMAEKFRTRIPLRSMHDADKFLFADGSLPLFDIARYTSNFERACEIMWDVYVAKRQGKDDGSTAILQNSRRPHTMHIAVAPSVD